MAWTKINKATTTLTKQPKPSLPALGYLLTESGFLMLETGGKIVLGRGLHKQDKPASPTYTTQEKPSSNWTKIVKPASIWMRQEKPS